MEVRFLSVAPFDMHTFYIDVPADFDYPWHLCPYTDPTGERHEATGPEILRVMYPEVKIKFICNSYANLSVGDVHQIDVENESDEIFFLLKTGFLKIDAQEIEEFISKKR